ncbi:Metacaspase-1 [Psilocybe cubensis]|uniref:Metacaspase-1 n=2 Tax=Psilocybe cubensis TaxID=181762 RepID=A0ACB8GT40_PSICU|nr:Metacaspase-1 [Psilocybe cubensis]KAH9478592.1 Metacaspase-1 [Psilocybe cubensis]
MKIIRSRLWPQGRRQAVEAAVLAATAVAEQAVANPAPAVKTPRKKALLIGCQEVRDQPPLSPASPGPLSPLSARFNRSDNFAVTGLKRMKTKMQEKKSMKQSLLKGPHRDVEALRKLLIEVYDYKPEDIVILIDNDLPGHKQPTQENIMYEMKKLVEGAQEGDRFFFHFSGHSVQEDTEDISEEDRKNEFIETSDGKRIKDDILKETLVDPLPPKTSLIAVFDSCHSGSLLDLKHFRCNRVYVPWINKGTRKTATLLNSNSEFTLYILRERNDQLTLPIDLFEERQRAKISMPNAITRLKAQAWAHSSIDKVLISPTDSISIHEGTPNPGTAGHVKSKLSITTDLVSTSASKFWIDSPTVRQECSSPVAMYCTGYCRQHALHDESAVQADVISISSAKDGQKSWEDRNGTSMTQVLVNILRKDPHPTLADLMTLVSHDIHAFYVDLHDRAREYKKAVRIANEKMRKKGKKPREGDPVEMNNFQNPQVSILTKVVLPFLHV